MSSSEKSLLVFYSLNAFLNGIVINMRAIFLPELAVQTNTSNVADLGNFFLALGAGGVIFALPTGILVDRVKNQHYILVCGLLLRILTLLLIPYFKDLTYLSIDAVFLGASLPLVGVTVRTCLVWAASSKNTNSSLNFMMGMYGLGSIIAAPLHLLVKYLFPTIRPLQSMLYVLGALHLLSTIGAFVLSPPPKGIVSEEDNSSVRDSSDSEALESVLLESEEIDRTDSPSRTESTSFLSTTVIIILTASYLGMSVGAENAVAGWLYSISIHEAHLSVEAASILNTTLWISFTATRFFVAFLSKLVVNSPWERKITRYLLYTSHVFALASLAFYCSAPKSRLALWVLSVVFGSASAVWFPNGTALARQLMPLSGFVQAAYAISANMGNAVVPACAGWLAKPLGHFFESGEVAGMTLSSAASVVLMHFILTFLSYNIKKSQ
eukprot:g5397.t1